VTVKRAASTIRFVIWIDVEHDARHLAPIGALGVGIEHADVGDRVPWLP
jgi:hypothetical protein